MFEGRGGEGRGGQLTLDPANRHESISEHQYVAGVGEG